MLTVYAGEECWPTATEEPSGFLTSFRGNARWLQINVGLGFECVLTPSSSKVIVLFVEGEPNVLLRGLFLECANTLGNQVKSANKRLA